MRWINYYAKFNKLEFRKVMHVLNECLFRCMKFERKSLGAFSTAIRSLGITVQNAKFYLFTGCIDIVCV